MRRPLLGFVAIGCLGCYAYYGVITVDGVYSDRAAAADGDARVDLVTEVSSLAASFGLVPSDYLEWAQEHPTPGYEYTPVALFQGTEGRARSVMLRMERNDDGSELRFVIRDMDATGETDLTRPLRERLERELAKRFGEEHVRFERSKVGPNFYAG